MKKILAGLAASTILAFSASESFAQKKLDPVLRADTEGVYLQIDTKNKKNYLFFPQLHTVKIGMLNAFPEAGQHSLEIPLLGSPEARSDLSATTPFVMLAGVKGDFVLAERKLTISKMLGFYNFNAPAAGLGITKKTDHATFAGGALFNFKNKSLPHAFLQASTDLKKLWGFQLYKGQKLNEGTLGISTGNNGLRDGGNRTRLYAGYEAGLNKNLSLSFTAYAQNLKESETTDAKNSVGIVAAAQHAFGRRSLKIGPAVSYDTKSGAAFGLRVTTKPYR